MFVYYKITAIGFSIILYVNIIIRPREYVWGRSVMFFLLRMAFWILLICLLLPGSREDNRRLMSSAERTVSDVRGFCQRNPEVCEDARLTLTAMLSKLKNGAEIVQTWLARGEVNGGEAGAASSQPPPFAEPPGSWRGQQLHMIPKWQDSLKPDDRQVPWRGPAHL
jgi:Family of unknown function (DUF5330)